MLGLTSALSSSSEKEQNYALSFDGVNDYVGLGPSNGIITASQDPISFSCWVKTTSTSDGYIFSCQRSNGGSAFSVKIADNGIASGVIWNGVSAHTFPESTTVVNDGNWHHLAIVAKDGNQKIYVDGALEDTHTSTMDVIPSADHCAIGAHTAGATYRYNGSLTGLAVYTVELDANAITSIYNAGRHHNLNTPISNYSSTPSHYYALGYGLFDDKDNGFVYDQVNPGYGSNLVSNSDFSANEAEAADYLNGGLVFDDWTEQNNGGLRKYEITADGQGIRCTIETATSQTWHQRIYQGVSDHLDIGSSYELSIELLASTSCTFRAAVQTTGSGDTQTSTAMQSISLSPNVRTAVKDVFRCDNNSSQVVHLFPNSNLPAGEYYEIRNPRLRKINGALGDVEGATFVTDN